MSLKQYNAILKLHSFIAWTVLFVLKEREEDRIRRALLREHKRASMESQVTFSFFVLSLVLSLAD